MKQWFCLIVSLMVVGASMAQTAVVASDSITFDAKHAESSRRVHRDSTEWHPVASRAVWLGAVVPGLGQIYNRKYWKLPIVYGAFVGCAYAITWNNGMYNDYRSAYMDLRDVDVPSTDPMVSYNSILPKGYTIEMMGGKENYQQILKTRMTRYHRYRDLSIVATVGVYVLTLIDAYVDAQLFDYDISPDVSMHVAPEIYQDPLFYNKRTTGLTFCIHF